MNTEREDVKVPLGPVETLARLALQSNRYRDDRKFRDAVDAVFNIPLYDAAPDLLTALKWMVEHDETGDTPMEEKGGRSWNEINAYWLDGLNRARTAISRAEGKQ